jgi:hypothetical protein
MSPPHLELILGAVTLPFAAELAKTPAKVGAKN